jgi:alkylated DNA repair dioxygenase AlkB
VTDSPSSLSGEVAAGDDGRARGDGPPNVRTEQAFCTVRPVDTLTWQPSLLDAGADPTDGPVFDRRFGGLARRELSAGAWVDVVRDWCSGHDELFERVFAAGGWAQHRMAMYGELVAQPRLRAHWGTRQLPPALGVLHEAVELLSRRYGVPLDRVTANLYRDGDDAVAWHGDTDLRDRDRAVVAVLTLGTARAFHLRPRAGGAAVRLTPRPGDLVVMGGTCQRTWQHAVPRTRRPVGPRICVMFRHDPDTSPHRPSRALEPLD